MGTTSGRVLLALLAAVALAALVWIGRPRPAPSPVAAVSEAPAPSPRPPAGPAPDAPRPLVVDEPAPAPRNRDVDGFTEGVFTEDASTEPLRFTDDAIAVLERALEERGVPEPAYIGCEAATCEMGWDQHLDEGQLAEANDVLSTWDLPFVFTPYRRDADPSVMSWFRRRLTQEEAKAVFAKLADQSDDIARDLDAGP